MKKSSNFHEYWMDFPMINIFIGPTVRSGGSLLNRLFDHHPDVAAYPFELFLPMDDSLHPSLKMRGQKLNVQNFPAINEDMDISTIMSRVMLSKKQENCLVGSHFRNGKLIAKTSYMKVEASSNHEKFINDFTSALRNSKKVSDVYNSMHEALFRNWDEGKHSGTMKYVVYHSGNGLLADIPLFLEEFEGSFFIQPIRSIYGCLASEKKKIVRQLIGGGRIGSLVNIPDRLLKLYFGRFFEQILVNWLVTFTRSVILKERLGERYIIYRHEDLVRNPDNMMKLIVDHIGLEFHENLLAPSVAGFDWRGNSMFGKQSGINPELAEIRDVFNKTEKELVNKYCGYINHYLNCFENEFVDFGAIDKDKLFDYDLQERYYNDRGRTALYFVSMYERWKYDSVWSQIKGALNGKPQPYFLK